LDFLEVYFGARFRKRILQRFQLREEFLAQPDQEVSLRLLMDLCSELRMQGFADEQFREMGCYSMIASYATPLGAVFREARQIRSLMERSFTHNLNRFYDDNFFYHLESLTDGGCRVRVECNPEAVQAWESQVLGSSGVCLVHGGLFAALPGYLDLPYARVNEPSCVHRGDPQCFFELDFSLADWVARHR
jgi:hypothetical protein